MKLGPTETYIRGRSNRASRNGTANSRGAGSWGKYLWDVDQSADWMKALLLKQLAEKRPYNPVEWNNSLEAWEGLLERIADELVLEDRVLVSMPEVDGEGP